MLKQLASRLRNTLRESDKIGRLGGDEFAIIQFGDEQPKKAAALATRLIELIKAPFDIDDQRLVIGASIGIAVADGDYQDADQLLRAADLAMYRAKADGRGRFRFFEPEFDRQVQGASGSRGRLARSYRPGRSGDPLPAVGQFADQPDQWV